MKTALSEKTPTGRFSYAQSFGQDLFLFQKFPRPRFCSEDRVKIGVFYEVMRQHGLFDAPHDVKVADLSGKELCHGPFVRSVIDCRERSARAAGFVGEGKAGEVFGIRRVKGERRQFRKIKQRRDGRPAVGPGQGIFDGKAHVRYGQLGLDGAVREFDH